MIFCQNCGMEAPTKYVAFYENIGAIFVRYRKYAKGHMCKRCINHYFGSYTLTTLFLGWWGVVSFIVTPFILLNNLGRYLLAIRLPKSKPGLGKTELTDDAVARVRPYLDEIISRLQAKEDIEVVSRSIAPRAGATPGQVWRYITAVIELARREQEAKAKAAQQPATQPAVAAPSTAGAPVEPATEPIPVEEPAMVASVPSKEAQEMEVAAGARQ